MTDTATFYNALSPRIEKLIDEMSRMWEARWDAFLAHDDRTRIDLLNFIKNNPRLTDELFLECWRMYLSDTNSYYMQRKHPSWCFFRAENFNAYSAQAVHSLRNKGETKQTAPAPEKTVQQQAAEVGERLKAIQALQRMKRQLGEGLANEGTAASSCGTV